MEVLVIEYTLSGFAPAGEITLEGYAMLHSLIADLRAAGYRALTVLDPTYASSCNLPADAVLKSGNDPLATVVKEGAKADAVIVIAPALRRALPRIVKALYETGANVIGPSPEAAILCSNKWNLYARLSSCSVPVPKTEVVSFKDGISRAMEVAREVGFPLIVKPVDGVGCAGLSLVTKEEDLPAAISRVRSETEEDVFLVQEYLEGSHISACLIVTRSKSTLISLNEQVVRLGPPEEGSSYEGGLTPLMSPAVSHLSSTCTKAIDAIPGLKGFVGIDMVVTQSGPAIVDVNPRLTTSYVGVRRAVEENVADLLLREGFEPPAVVTVAIYRKLRSEGAMLLSARSYLSEAGAEAFLNPSVLHPQAAPMCTELALVVAWGATVAEAERHFESMRRRILSERANRGRSLSAGSQFKA